jgi:hypothetical protein
MKRILFILFATAGLCAMSGDVSGRGFGGGGFHGGYSGSFSHGGYSGSYSGSHSYSGGWGGEHASSYSSFSGEGRYGGSYSGSRSTESSSGWGGRSASSSYDHNWTSASGGSINTSGTRSASEGRYGGYSASGSRDTTVTTAGGKTYSGGREGSVSGNRYTGYASGSREGSVTGPGGSAGWESAFSGNRYTGNMNHYASVYGANGAHSTAYWSTGYMNTHATSVRTSFNYYNCFHPDWYISHPGSWIAPGWVASSAWLATPYAAVASYCSMPAESPPDYDYGSTVVYQNNNVYVNGQDSGTVEQYAQQATDLATQGQAPVPTQTDEWKALGVFALVQGDETTSNNIFQLAVNKDGTIRGNYYDGLQDTNTEVFGSVDKKTQRAAWTIGKKKDRVFEAGVYNLTQPQCPCLLHLSTKSTSQMMLVRVEQPKNGSQPGQ